MRSLMTTLSIAAATLLAPAVHAETGGWDTGWEPTGGSTPPDVQILTPDDGATVPTSLNVEVWVDAGDFYVEAVNLWVDGSELPASCSGEGACQFAIELAPGEHVLTATAWDYYTSASHEIVVNVQAGAEPPPAATTAPPPADPPPDDPDDVDGTTGDLDGDADNLGSVDRGCACTTGTPGVPYAGILGLFLIGGLRRVRRRR